MAMLRLPTRERTGFNLKRLTFLSPGTTNVEENDVSATSGTLAWEQIPSLELMKVADFATMFEDGMGERQGKVLSAVSFQTPGLPPKPNISLPTSTLGNTARLQEYELPATAPRRRPLAVPIVLPSEDPGDMRHTSSTSSSELSAIRSRTSSPPSRQSSMSSVTDPDTTAEGDMHEKQKQTALHIRLKRRPQDNRIASIDKSDNVSTTRLPLQYSQTHVDYTSPTSRAAERLAQATGSLPVSPRRGERLGTAIAENKTASPANFFYTSPSYPAVHNPRSKRRPSSSASTSQQNRTTSVVYRRPSRRIKPVNVNQADQIRVQIMSKLDNVADLLSCAMTNKEFYATFQRYESLLVDRVLFNQSPAAWELRYSVLHVEKPSPFRLRSILQDLDSLCVLQDFITMGCHDILRKDSHEALQSEGSKRKAELEDALWSIWTFCILFGKSSPNESSLAKQVEWLNGGSQSKDIMFRTAIKKKRLEDMMEMWQCLEHLMSGFRGQELAARKAGLFDNTSELGMSESALLDIWITDILSRGPKAVLTLWSCDFEQAKMLGLTRWTPPATGRDRSNFFKAAVEEVYRERLMQEAKQKALDFRKSRQVRRRSMSEVPPNTTGSRKEPRDGDRRASLRISTAQKPLPPMPTQAPPPVPIGIGEIMPDCDPRSSVHNICTPVLSASTNPTIFSPLSMTANTSAKLGPTLFPVAHTTLSSRQLTDDINQNLTLTQADDGQQDVREIVDPADIAMNILTLEMGFPSPESKRALAMSDSGSGLDLQKAIDILTTNTKFIRPQRQSQIMELPTAQDDEQPVTFQKSAKPEYYEDTCNRYTLVEPQKDRVTGLGLVRRTMNARMSLRRSTRLSVIMDAEENSSPDKFRSKNKKLASLSASSTNPARHSLPGYLASYSSSSTAVIKASTTTFAPAPASAPTTPVLPHTQSQTQTPHGSPQPGRRSSDTMEIPRATTALPMSLTPARPRVILTRVGSGAVRRGWSFGGRKPKEPEIIGYAAY